MMFLFYAGVPEEKPKRSFKPTPMREDEYFSQNAEQLKDVVCPNCGCVGYMFKGCVYLGCRACLCYFSEKEVIEANI